MGKRLKMPCSPWLYLVSYDTCIYLHDHRPQQDGVIDANLSVTSTKESTVIRERNLPNRLPGIIIHAWLTAGVNKINWQND